MSLCGVVGVEDLLLLARRGGRLTGQQEQEQETVDAREKVACRAGSICNESEYLRQ